MWRRVTSILTANASCILNPQALWESYTGGRWVYPEVGGCIVYLYFHLIPKQSMMSFNHYFISRNESQLRSSRAEGSSLSKLPTENKACK